jgi:hypothetical protein
MTFVGKVFVMVNVALSLFFAFFAFGVYSSSIDWGYDAAKPGQAGGILKELQKEIDQLKSMQGPVESSWRKARAELRVREERRSLDRGFYTAEFDFLRTRASAADPAKAVVVLNNQPVIERGQPKLTAEIPPAGDRAGKPLLSLAAYDQKLETAQKDNAAVLDQLKKAVEEDIRLTNLLIDAPGRKGLRTQLVEERVKRDGVFDEQRLVEPLFVNTAVESELVFKRKESLEARIRELEAYMKKRKMDITLSKR